MRRLALVIALLLLAPTSAEAAVCVHKPPPPKISKAEQFLRQTIAEGPYIQTLDLRRHTIEVMLSAPLGDRVVRNIRSGGRVRSR